MVNDAIYDLSLEWFEYDSASRSPLGPMLEEHAFSNVPNGDDGDGTAELAGTRAFNV